WRGTLGVAGNESAVDATSAVAQAVPVGLVLGAFALAAIAVAVPYARTPWRIAGLGAGALATIVLAVPTAPALPLVAAIWLTCVGLGLRAAHFRCVRGGQLQYHT